MALALRALGKEAEVVMDAMPPHFLQPFPAVSGIRIARDVSEATDGAVIMECSSLDRTGVTGLDRSPVLNIDHHVGNTHYGAINWIDESAAACTRAGAFTLIDALGAPLDKDIATHIYLGLLTDTGSFHFSHITAAQLRDRTPLRRSRRQPAVDCAHALRQQHARTGAHFRPRAQRHAARRLGTRCAAHDTNARFGDRGRSTTPKASSTFR